jgi:hypothetical protein
MKKAIFKISVLVLFLILLSKEAKAQFNYYMKNTSTGGVIVRVYDINMNLLDVSGTIAGGSSSYVTINTCVTGVPATIHIIDGAACLTNINVNSARALSSSVHCLPPPGSCCPTYGWYFTSTQTTSTACTPITYELNILID